MFFVFEYTGCAKLARTILDRDAFRERKENGSPARLARELVDLDNETGRAYRRRDELHRRAEANRAFAHFLR